MTIKTIRRRESLTPIRRAVADYMNSEGCSCCEGPSHKKDRDRLGVLLRIPKYSDGSGHDFGRYETKKDTPFPQPPKETK